MKKVILVFISLLLFIVNINNISLSYNKNIVNNNTYADGNTTNNYMKITMTSSSTSSSGYSLTPYTSGQSIGVMRQNSLNLQKALDVASNSGGGEVILPSGTFYFAMTGLIYQTTGDNEVGPVHGNETYAVRLRNNVLLRGQGTSTVLRQYNVADTNRTGSANATTSNTGDPGIDMFFFNAYKEADFPSSIRTKLGESTFNYDTTTVSYKYYKLKSAVNSNSPSESDYELVQESNTLYLINADFKDFVIDGTSNGANGYTSSGKAFMVNLFKDCDWENVIVKNINATGFGMDAPIDSTMKNCKAINCGKQARITYSSNLEVTPGGSGFGIGTGASNQENILIENCESYNNAKFGYFFEHQGRFKAKVSGTTTPVYQATTSTGLVVRNSKAGGNMYDFGGLQANDVIYDNVTSYSGQTSVIANDNSNVTLNTDNFTPAKFTLFSKQKFFINSNLHNNVTDFNTSTESLAASRWVVDNGILDATGGKTFGRTNTLTRFDVLLTLYNYTHFRKTTDISTLIYSPVTYANEVKNYFTDIFTDISNISIPNSNGNLALSNYSVARDIDSLKWAHKKGLLLGSADYISDYNSNCTRLQFITFLYRLAGSPDVADHDTVFTDVAVTNKPVYWALENGITNGDGSSSQFNPNVEITKEQVALFLYRYDKDNNKNKSYYINYYKMGGSWVSGETGPSTYSHGSSVTLNQPKKTGYTFSGWRGTGLTSNTQNVTIGTSAYGDRVYYPIWTPNTYTIAYSDQGTLTNKPTSGTYSQNVGVDNPTKSIAVSFNQNGTNATIGGSATSWSSTLSGTYSFTGWDITGMDGTTHNYGKNTTTVTSLTGTKATVFKNLRASSGTVTFTGTWTSPTITLPTITKTGYVCKWNSAANGNGEYTWNSGGIYTPSSVTTRTLYAVCTPNTYSLNYSLDYGTLTNKPTTGTYDTSLTISNPTKSIALSFNQNNSKATINGSVTSWSSTLSKNYTFAGWNITGMDNTTHTYGSNTSTATSLSGIKVTTFKNLRATGGTVSFSATWTPPTITLPTITKAGHTCKWTSTTGSETIERPSGGTYTPATTAGTTSRTFDASCTPNTYTVIYDSNGGSGSMTNQAFTYGTAQNLKSNSFTRTGYTFAGWATSDNGNVVYTDGQSVNNLTTTNNGTITLYAKWTGISYSVKYNGNGSTSGSMSNQSFVYGTSQYLSSNLFTRTGYTFAGWAKTSTGNVVYSNGQSVSNLTSTNNGTVNLYAKWTANTYTVKFNSNGGTGSMGNQTFTYGNAQNLNSNIFTKTGYTFVGWATSTNGNVVYTDGQSVSNLTSTNNGTINLYAKWTVNTYTVKFNSNGGSGSMTDQAFTYGTSQNLKSNSFTKTGYTFAGWATSANGNVVYTNGQSVVNITTNNNVTINLYAKWTANTYTVKFNSNGATSGSMSNQIFTYGTSQKLNSNGFSKTGYKFDGWATSSTGNVVYIDSQSVSNLTSTSNGIYNLYAKWSPITYTIKFNSNGGSGTMSNQSFSYDEEKPLKANAFTKEDYSFAGWNTKADGSGTRYNNKASVKNLTTTDGPTINLYAQWVYGTTNYEINDYVVRDSYIYINESTNKNSYVNHFEFSNDNYSIKIFKGNTELSSTASIPNGSTTKVYINGTLIDTYINIVVGDFNENGEITIADVSKLFTYLSSTYSIPEYTFLAGDINRNSNITIADVSGLYTYIQNK